MQFIGGRESWILSVGVDKNLVVIGSNERGEQELPCIAWRFDVKNIEVELQEGYSDV